MQEKQSGVEERARWMNPGKLAFVLQLPGRGKRRPYTGIEK
jgi:hypothetical protein